MAGAADGSQKIGSASHRRRNLGLLVLLVGAAVAMVLYYTRMGQKDAVAMQHLDSFLTTYANKCGTPGAAEATPPAVKDAYLSSALLKEVVGRELAALEKGASCDEVAKSLRAADFPMSSLPARKVAAP